MTTAQRAVDAFVDAGMLATETGVLPRAAGELAAQLLAEGHADILGEVTAQFWSANAARLARRDRWKAATTIRAGLDPGEKEPPPPNPPPPPPPPEPTPQPDPPSDRSAS